MNTENKNKKIVWGVVSVIVLVAVFYGGIIYDKSQIPTRGQSGQFGVGGNGGGGNGGGNRLGRGGGTFGKIIAKDDKSITVEIASGGSKIIFFGGNTKVSKSVDGAITDLAIGTQISVMGAANTDGSINAENVQIRPAQAPKPQN